MASIEATNQPKRADALQQELCDALEPDVLDRFNPWDTFFVLWGILSVLPGIYFTFGRFIEDSVRRSHTIYAVTDRHAILPADIPGHNARSISLSGLREINLSKKTDGRGTITLGHANNSSDRARRWPGAIRGASSAFQGIARAQDVLKIIRDAQRASA